MEKQHKKIITVVASLLAVVLVMVSAFFIYVGGYSRADDVASAAMVTDESVVVQQSDDYTVFWPQTTAKAGLIFYPGGLVETSAYAPLCKEFAQNGVLCILLEMPFHLAVFDSGAADKVREIPCDVQNWYIGGHSLGGAMASSYVQNNTQRYKGLWLFAAYSTADLSQSGLQVVSMYGSNDGVMNRASYQKSLNKYPQNFAELVIEGGNHAQFGSYGAQKGDNAATITAQQQRTQAVQFCLQSCGI